MHVSLDLKSHWNFCSWKIYYCLHKWMSFVLQLFYFCILCNQHCIELDSLFLFSGGQWNSGGACDRETEPIKNEKYLSPYPSKMSVLESVIKGMKTPVSYLNITRMTDYRKDAHPSVYRKQNLTEEERKNPLSFQDCSHWCLPGVPDAWNELLYAQLIIKQYQMAQ